MNPINFEKIEKGLIPWSSGEFNQIKIEFHKILLKPKDDWDITLKAKSSQQVTSQDWVTPGLHPYHPMAQLKKIIINKYNNQEKAIAHFIRYNQIIKFLQTHEALLREESLVQFGANPAYIKNELITCLCLMPYALNKEPLADKNEYSFCYADVIHHTKELIAKNSNPS